MLASDLSEYELNMFSTLERVSSVLSLFGICWIMFTFLGSKLFHKPINRMVFYASIGNIFTSVATLISREALKRPDSALCQFQGVLVQMFLPADALWTFAMALNVILTFYFHFDAEGLRRLEKYYFMSCYGLPFIPAIVFVFIQTPEKGRMYGNATLWCWVGASWDVMRIATFYAPVWLIILATIAIYIRCGKDIFVRRQQLRNFRAPAPDPIPIMHDPFSAEQSTQIRVDKHIVITESDNMDIDLEQLNLSSDGGVRRPAGTSNFVNISASQIPRSGNNMQYSSWPEKSQADRQRDSIVITTIPATLTTSNIIPTRRYAAMEANTAIYSYTKVALMFFCVMMITWIPSSANRVFSVVHKGQVSLPLEYISATVLPLQGFWNAVIYTITSWPAVKALWRQLRSGKRLSGGGLKTMAAAFSSEGDKQAYRSSRQGNNRPDKYFEETDSVTELHLSRPTTGHTTNRPSTENSH